MNAISSAANHAMSVAANATGTGTGSQTQSSAATTGPDALTSESTFLKLLVAQIKNQDPTNPTDSTQFVGQLTQYSELEQLIGINSGVKQLASPTTSTTDPTTNGSTNKTN